MKSKAMKLCVTAALMAGCISAAHAAGEDTNLVVTGEVTATTCDISIFGGGVVGGTLQLGSHLASEFTSAPYGDKVGMKTVNINASGCSGTNFATGDKLAVDITMSADSQMDMTHGVFGNDNAPGFGISLFDGAGVLQTPEADKITLKSDALAAAPASVADASFSIPVGFALNSTAATVTAGTEQATFYFTAYNGGGA